MQSILISELKKIALYFKYHFIAELKNFPLNHQTNNLTPDLFSTYWKSKTFETSKANALIIYSSMFSDLPDFSYNFFELEILDLYNSSSFDDFSKFAKRMSSLLDYYVTFYQSHDFSRINSYSDHPVIPSDELYEYLYLLNIKTFYSKFYLPLLKLFFTTYLSFIPHEFLLYTSNAPLYDSLNFTPPVLPPIIFNWHYAVALAILQNCKQLPSTIGHKKLSISQAMAKFNLPEKTANTVYCALLNMINPANKEFWDINYMFKKHFITTNHTGYKSVVLHLIGQSRQAILILNGLTEVLLVFLTLS